LVILIFELTWTGTYHAPGNSVTIQTISRACPGEEVRVFAEASHLRELQRDEALRERPGISFHEMPLAPWFRYRQHIVSIRRMMREFNIIRSALRAAPRREPCLIMFLSATSTAIFVAASMLRLARRSLAVQVGLHGELHSLIGWRPRNPLTRALDFTSALRWRHDPRLRFLVLEEPIRQELTRIAPAAAERTDVLPLPVNLGELPLVPEPELRRPVQIGFVGQATEAKGIAAFLDTAAAFRERYPGLVEFHLVGRVMPDSDLARFAVLDSEASEQHLSRQEFLDRLARLHFVFLPFKPGYYNLSASGALLDAITWLKPIIATRLPIVSDLFARFGDIGYLCNDPEEMRAALAEVVTRLDPARYREQTVAMRRARAARMPSVLADRYRGILSDGFGL
jgi:glycosyltransferase involved in cell wall biosynthesis